MSRPMKTSPDSWPNLTAPRRSLMPYCVTIARAVAVALSVSVLPPGGGARARARAVLRHQRAGCGGGLLDVVARAGGRVVEDQLLRCPAAHGVRQHVQQ